MFYFGQIVRGVMRRGGSSAFVVVLCAVGVALSTSIFAVIDSVLVNPLPYAHADRLVVPWCVAESFGVDRYPFSWDNYRDYRDQVDAFEELAAVRPNTVTLESTGRPTSVNGARVTSNFLDVLGISPVLGRAFADDIDEGPEEGVVMITHGLWQRVFAGAQDIIGQVVRLDGKPHTVIGVLPRELRYPRPDVEVYVPLSITTEPETVRAFHFLRLVGRLKAGRSLEDGEAQMQTLASQLAETFPEANLELGARIVPLKEEIIGTSRRSLLTLFSAVQLLFCVAWANIAILLLVRGLARRGELQLRAALGATRWRLFALLIGEATLLAILGTSLGVAGGFAVVQTLPSVDASLLPRAGEIRFTGALVLWAFAINFVAIVLFGSLPAWASSRAQETDLRTTRATDRRRARLSARLAGAQVALAIPLLVASSMHLRSLRALVAVETGFDERQTLVAGAALPVNQFGPADQKAYVDRALERLATLPGVSSVGAMSHLPLSNRAAALVVYRPEQAGESGLPNAHYRVVSHGLLRSLGIALVSGREFEPRDNGGERPMVILDETLAEVLFPDRDPVGRMVRLGSGDTNWEVIGVARAAQLVSLDNHPEYTVYVPILQNRFPSGMSLPKFVLRTEANPSTLVNAARDTLQAVDPNQAVLDVRPLEEQIDGWLTERRAIAWLLWVIGGAAAALASAGIYATLAFAVAQRLRELAIRSALGAGVKRLFRTTIVDGVRPGFAGIVVGLVASAFVGWHLLDTLYGVAAIDYASMATASLLMVTTMLIACVSPSRRAIRVDPLRLLREEDGG